MQEQDRQNPDQGVQPSFAQAEFVGGLVALAYELANEDLPGWLTGLQQALRSRLGVAEHLAGVWVCDPTNLEGAPGWVSDDLSVAAGVLGEMSKSVVIDGSDPALEAAVPSGLAGGLCADHLGGFLRVVVPVLGLDSARTMFVQIESRGDDGLAPWARDAIRIATTGFAAAYAHGIGRLREQRHTLMEPLSQYERLAAGLLVEGRTENSIAKQLDKSPHTIHEYVKRIYRAWGVRNRMQMRDRWFDRRLARSD